MNTAAGGWGCTCYLPRHMTCAHPPECTYPALQPALIAPPYFTPNKRLLPALTWLLAKSSYSARCSTLGSHSTSWMILGGKSLST